MTLKAEKESEVDALIGAFLVSVKRAKFKNESLASIGVARRAAEILRTVVTHTGRTNIDGLLKTVWQKGKRLSEAAPFGLIIENVTRRVMYIIREEYEQIIRDLEAAGERPGHLLLPTAASAPSTPALGPLAHGPVSHGGLEGLALPPAEADGDPTITPRTLSINKDSSNGSHRSSPDGLSPLRKVVSALNPVLSGMMEPTPTMLDVRDAPRAQEILWIKGKWKGGVISHLSEYIQTELGDMQEMIRNQAREHLYENDVVLMLGHSSIVEAFALRSAEALAKKGRGFDVLVAEGAPSLNGHLMAKNLAAAGVKTTVIPDSAIYAMMSRVNKVLLGPYAVLADGGIIAQAGTHMLALAAKAHRAPVVVLAGLYKLSPVFPVNPKSFADLNSAAPVLPYQAVYRTNLIAQQRSDSGLNHLHVRNPLCDYVPPNLIHTYVTNNGSLNPSYIYRFLAEMYNPEDYDL
jgi:translation initiation factor eIF-2B subunit beta